MPSSSTPFSPLAAFVAALVAALLMVDGCSQRVFPLAAPAASDAAVVAAADRSALPAFIFIFNTLVSATSMLQVCTLFINCPWLMLCRACRQQVAIVARQRALSPPPCCVMRRAAGGCLRSSPSASYQLHLLEEVRLEGSNPSACLNAHTC